MQKILVKKDPLVLSMICMHIQYLQACTLDTLAHYFHYKLKQACSKMVEFNKNKDQNCSKVQLNSLQCLNRLKYHKHTTSR